MISRIDYQFRFKIAQKPRGWLRTVKRVYCTTLEYLELRDAELYNITILQQMNQVARALLGSVEFKEHCD